MGQPKPSTTGAIILYSAEWCSDCQRLKAFLDAHGIRYELRDIQKNPEYRKDLLANAGEIAVPFLIMNGKWVRGYPDGEGYSEEYARRLFKAQ
jgi:glutaredoxin-like protein NrdH